MKVRFKEGDEVIYEAKHAIIVKYRGCYTPVIKFEDGHRLGTAYPEKMRKCRKKLSAEKWKEEKRM